MLLGKLKLGTTSVLNSLRIYTKITMYMSFDLEILFPGFSPTNLVFAPMQN